MKARVRGFHLSSILAFHFISVALYASFESALFSLTLCAVNLAIELMYDVLMLLSYLNSRRQLRRLGRVLYVSCPVYGVFY